MATSNENKEVQLFNKPCIDKYRVVNVGEIDNTRGAPIACVKAFSLMATIAVCLFTNITHMVTGNNEIVSGRHVLALCLTSGTK